MKTTLVGCGLIPAGTVGETYAAAISTSGILKTYKPVRSSCGTVLTTAISGAGAVTVKSLIKECHFSIENPLSDERTIFGVSDTPRRAGGQKITGTLVGWDDNTASTGTRDRLYAPFAADLPVRIILTYTSGTEYIQATTPWSLSFDFYNVRLTGRAAPNCESTKEPVVTYSFEAWYDLTNEPLTITLVNSNVTALTA
jgi:hypothetical protein